MEQSAIELYEESPTAIYVLQVHGLDPDQDVVGTQALVLLQREGGFLLAVPAGAFSEEILNAAAEGDPFLAYGAHANFIIRFVSPEGLQGEEAEVTVIDTELNALAHLNRMPDPVPPEVLTFGADPFMLPDVVSLMQFTRDWIAQCQEGQQLALLLRGRRGAGNRNSKGVASYPEVSRKAEGKECNHSFLGRSASRAYRSSTFADSAAASSTAGPRRAEVQAGCLGIGASAPAEPDAGLGPSSEFCQDVRKPPSNKGGRGFVEAPMTTTEMVDGEEVEKSMPGGGALAQAVLEQSRALTSLVSQLSQGGDPLLDGHQGSSAISLGSRGAQGREKLQQELASRSGGFFLSVLQNAYKRMKPAARVPTSIPSCAGAGHVHGQLLGEIRWLRAIARDGASAVEPGAHFRLCTPRGSRRSQRTCCTADDRGGASCSGQQSMGSCLSTDAVGGATITALGVSPCGDPVQAAGFRAVVRSEVGRNCSGFCEGSGFYTEQEGRVDTEATDPTCSRRRSKGKTEAKEEAKMARRRSRRKRQQERKRGLSDPSKASFGLCMPCPSSDGLHLGEGSGISSPSSTMSARLGFAGTAKTGRERKGHNFPPEKKDEAEGVRAATCSQDDSLQELGSEFNAAAKVGVPLCIWTNSQVRRILASRTSFSYYLSKTITLCRGSRSGPSTALFPIPVPVDGPLGGWPEEDEQCL